MTPALLTRTWIPPSSSTTRVDRGVDRLGVADVAADADAFASPLRGSGGGLGGGGLVEVEHRDRGALLREPRGGAEADAPRRAR